MRDDAASACGCRRVLITAGPTREPVDTVRYLGNRSSGRMGFALAEAFAEAGKNVTLVAGPVHLGTPAGVSRVDVETAQEMYRAVATELALGDVGVAVFAAAVADFRPQRAAGRKIKKGGAGESDLLNLELERTVDILGSVRGPLGFDGVLVGFAAETENLHANALAKLERKGCDLVVANDVSRGEIGFDSERNEVLLVYPGGGVKALPMQSKRELARVLVGEIEGL